MKMSSLVMPLILFTGIMVGFQSFGTDLLNNYGQNSDEGKFNTIGEKHQQLNYQWEEEGSEQSTWREEEGIIERATGALLIPRIASDIMATFENVNVMLDELATYRFVPWWAITMLKSLVGASIFFALVGGYLRFRS